MAMFFTKWLVIWGVQKGLAAKHPFTEKQSRHVTDEKSLLSYVNPACTFASVDSKSHQLSMYLPLMCQTVRKWNHFYFKGVKVSSE